MKDITVFKKDNIQVHKTGLVYSIETQTLHSYKLNLINKIMYFNG